MTLFQYQLFSAVQVLDLFLIIIDELHGMDYLHGHFHKEQGQIISKLFQYQLFSAVQVFDFFLINIDELHGMGYLRGHFH
jgi:hypothetical protein